MNKWLVILSLLGSIAVYPLIHSVVWDQRATVRMTTDAGFVLPSRFSRILALEHKGLLADFLLLKTITFFGGKVELEQPLAEQDWTFIETSLDVVTDLDPYFKDPYVLGQGLFSWEAGRYTSAIRLLEKGLDYRESDWELPFYIGFNYFYFLGDNERGADYLMRASRRPASPGFLPNLAARIGYYGGKSRTAIIFLRATIDGTSDPGVRKWLEMRLIALERAAAIEDALEKYVADNGNPPESLSSLVKGGYLDELPEDPYGGEWVLMGNGRVFSTSRFVYKSSGGQ